MSNRYVISLLMFGMSIIFGISEAHAQHKGISFQGVIKRPDGTLPTLSGISITAQILDPVNNCVLREELHTGKNISNGYLNLVLGDPSASLPLARNPSPVLSITEVMNNKIPRSGLSCVDTANNIVATNQTYSPFNVDRRVLRVRLNIQGEEISADFNMRAVSFAVNSELLNNKTDTDFVNVNPAKGVTQDNVENIFDRFTKLDAILNNFNSAGNALSANVSGNAATATTAVNVTGVVGIANGGTGASSVSAARTNLGLGSLATMSPTGTADSSTYLRGDGTWGTVTTGGAVSSVAGRTGSVVITSSDLSDFSTAADARITQQKGQNDGLATLNSSGKVPSSQLSLSSSDIPDLDYSKITTGRPTNLNGYGITDAIQNRGVNAATTVPAMSAGLDANKPATPVAGQVFMATDVQRIYRYDGTSWQVMASNSGSGGTITEVSAGSGLSGGGDTGSVALGLANISNNTLLANTSGSSAAPVATSVSTVIDTLAGATTQGSILYRGSAGWSVLAPGTSGQYLRTQGGSANPLWSALNIGVNDLISSVTGTAQFTSGSCSTNQTLTWSSLTDSFQCQNISIANNQVSGLGSLATKSSVDLDSSDVAGAVGAAKIAAGAISNSHIASGAAIAWSKIDKTGVTAGDLGAAPAAGSSAITTVGTVTAGTWNGATIPVAHGGTGSTTGSITGPADLTFAAGGINGSVNLVPTGLGTVDVASRRISSVATPTADTDAATKAYVDAASGGSSSCPVVAGSYFTVGGSPSFCRKASLNAYGSYTYASINNGYQCESGRYCEDGNCVAASPCTSSSVIGSTCAGGTTFAGNYNGYSYMVVPGGCADSTCSVNSGTDPYFAWDSSGGVFMGADSTSYGYTQSVSLASSSTTTQAAKFCRSLNYGGYTDWYLPAIEELNLLYTNRTAIGGFSETSYYWSSTEYNDGGAQAYRFTNGMLYPNRTKTNSQYVRCVRRF